MSDTLPNTPITAGVWVDVYALTGIAVGTKLIVENVGMCDVYLAVQATQPGPEHNDYNILKRTGPKVTNNAGDSGAWAFCGHSDGELNVSISTNNGFSAAPLDTAPAEVRQTDESGRVAMVSMTGEVHVAFKTDDISVNFQYGISTLDIQGGGVQTGSGSIGTIGSMATVSTGVSVGLATLESRDSVRYRAGHECQCALSVVFADPELNVNQYAGFLNGTDGWCPGYQGLDFGIWFIEGGNVNFIKQADFSIDKLDGSGPSGYNINPQTGQLIRPTYTWHGFLDMLLEVRTDDGRWVPVHRSVFVNSAIETHLENPNLPISVKIERTSGTGANLTIKTSSWRGGVLAGMEEDNASNRWFADFVLDRTNVGGSAVHLLTLRSKSLYQGKTNHIKTQVKVLVSTNNTNKDMVFKATRLSALDAADQAAIIAGFVDINTADSVLESSDVVRTLTTTLTDSIVGDVAVVQRNDQRGNTDVQGLSLYPDEDIVFAADGTGAGEISFQLNVRELH